MEAVALELDRVTRRFSGDAPAVLSLSFSVSPGEIFALFGPSGCGKTTTLRLIAGFEEPDDGRIAVGGRIVSDRDVHLPPEERRIGFVFQDYALFPHLTVASNVGFGLRERSRRERAARIREAIELAKLEGFEERFPHELSGGQQQRVAVARALAPDYPVVLLDEPLSNLDLSLRASLRSELYRMLKASGKTVVLVSHDRDEAFEMADRIGVMSGGQLRQVGTPESLHERPASGAVARLVCDGCILPGRRKGSSFATELGMFPIGEVGAHEELTLLVREDAVTLVRDPAGEAFVEKRVFRGPGYLFHVRLPSGASIRSIRAAADLDEGERVRLELDPEKLRILPAGDEAC